MLLATLLYIEKSCEKDFKEAKLSCLPDVDDKRLNKFFEYLVGNDCGILKCRGIPFKCTKNDLI